MSSSKATRSVVATVDGSPSTSIDTLAPEQFWIRSQEMRARRSRSALSDVAVSTDTASCFKTSVSRSSSGFSTSFSSRMHDRLLDRSENRIGAELSAPKRPPADA